MISLAFSAISLSLTSATFLFYQHEDILSFDAQAKQRHHGTNDPKIIFMIPTTMMYLFINIPRLFANGLLLAITPLLASLMLFIELGVSLCLSHCFIQKINNTTGIGGFLLGITNAICPNAPLRKIGMLNMISTICTVCKLMFLYPIVIYLSKNDTFVRQVGQNPDLFRCFESNLIKNETIKDECRNNFTPIICSPRLCNEDETSNQVLFHFCIPIIIGCLVLITIPSGFAISFLMRIDKLHWFANSVYDMMDVLSRRLQGMMKVKYCFHKSSKLPSGGVTDTKMENHPNMDIERDDLVEELLDEANAERTPKPGIIGEEKNDLETEVIVMKSDIEKPNVILINIRRIFAPPVEKRKLFKIMSQLERI